MRVACIGLTVRFWASALIAKPYVLMADNIIPAPKRRHTGIAAATSSKETQESKAMKNRKAKRLLQRPVRVVELVISNHKIAVLHPFGQVAFAAKRKPTASQNRRKKGYAVR
ncbi:hypothetical protein OHD33_28625 [Escherichia coli]|nr:hypothetical protein [Escherichia coli]